MALIQWKQIDEYLSGSKALTGSLLISGTIQADEFIGIDPTSIFTGSISASVDTGGSDGLGNIFVITSGSETLASIDGHGNLVVEGTVRAQEFFTEIVSASIIFESGSSQFGNTLDDTHKFTGSLFISGADGHKISGSITVSTTDTGSTAIRSNNTTVGYPTSNEWQDNLDGSYFDNFTHETHISEILRFMAGVMSSSLDVAAPTPNTKTWGSTASSWSQGSYSNKSSILVGVLGQGASQNALLSNNWRASAYIDSTKTGSFEEAQEYLIEKGFFLSSETGSDNVGTNPFNSPHYSNIPNSILRDFSFDQLSGTFNAQAVGTTIASSNSNYFGLGPLTNGGPTPYTVRIRATQSFSDNYSDQTPSQTSTFTTASSIDYTISSFGTSNGLILSKIPTTQPAVIPSAFQDGDFTVTTPLTGRKYTGGATDSNSISASGYYKMHGVVIGLKTGSQADFTTQTPVQSDTAFYLYVDHVPTDITTGTRTATVSNVELNRTSFSATSRSLSGAPYLLTTTYGYTFQGEVSGSFDPAYGSSTNPLTVSRPTNTWANIGGSSLSHSSVSVTTSGVQTNVASTRGVVSSDKVTQRSVGDIPRIDDICYLTSSYSFTLNSNSNNVQQTRTSQQNQTYSLKFRLSGRNWKSSAVNVDSTTQTFYSASLFGQQSSKGQLAIYSYAQGYDAGSLTGTSEDFSGEDFRIQINNNVLGFNGDSFTTNTFDTTNVLGNYDLQVKPGYLVDPGGSYGYWFDENFGSGTYKFYIRRFRTSGAKTSMTINVGKTLVNWDSTSNGVAAAVLFKSSASGSGANNTLSTARLFDPTETNSNLIESAVSADNFKNPFTDDLDLYGNIGGSVSSTTYTMPLRNADGMYLDNDDNEFYLIIRYKGDPSPITDISTSTS